MARPHAKRPPVALLCARPGRRLEVSDALADEGFDVACCAGRAAIVQEAMRLAPDVVVYEMNCSRVDHETLRILRCVCPTVPLVITGDGGSLESRRRLQEYRPLYFALHPTRRGEWRDLAHSVAFRSVRLAGR